jgi:alpha-L-fucosidase 2
MANIFARLGNGEKAKECLDLLVRYCTGTNLYTHHNDWRNMGVTLKYMHAGHAPFQIDANLGFTAGVYEMLMYSDNTKIKLLPSLPDSWKRGSVENLHARGGFTVSVSWDNGAIKAKITSKRGMPINVCAKGARLKNSPPCVQKSAYGDAYVLLNLAKGESVELEYQS